MGGWGGSVSPPRVAVDRTLGSCSLQGGIGLTFFAAVNVRRLLAPPGVEEARGIMLPMLAVSSSLRHLEPPVQPPPSADPAVFPDQAAVHGSVAISQTTDSGTRASGPEPSLRYGDEVVDSVSGRVPSSIVNGGSVAGGTTRRRRSINSRARGPWRGGGRDEGRVGGGDGSILSPPPALTVSGRWTLEPLHGRASGNRRRSSMSSSGAGRNTGARGGDAGRSAARVSEDRPSTVGEVGVGLVKRSLEIRMGKLELWPDPPVLGRVSHLIRFVRVCFAWVCAQGFVRVS